MDLRLCWLPCAQNTNDPNAYSQWKFHNDKQMFSMLFNSITSKEEKNAIFYIEVALLRKFNYLFG